MSTTQDLVESFFIMIIFILVGSILLIAVILPWDIMQPIFTAAGFDNYPASWGSVDDRDFMVDLLYGIVYACYIIGPLQFVISAVKSQDYDQYEGSGGRIF